MAEHVCPVWVGYLLASPLRKIFQNPDKILSDYVKEGMKVLDIGCAMGFFSLPMARMVGSSGRVICVDIQPDMLSSLKKRAEKAKVAQRVEMRLANRDSFCIDDLKNKIDFIIASAVAHELPDPLLLFSETWEVLTQKGTFLLTEPSGHVSKKKFKATVSTAEAQGFKIIKKPRIRRSHTVLLGKA
ncbi:MAG: class I SAM-dependent methyltransferase [Deltaproteobacteria bacterium]|nr:class I SAM-dependent methyltransferase [Deltaproteobacteria bacterium]